MTTTHSDGSELSDRKALVTEDQRYGRSDRQRLRQAGATVMTTARSRLTNLDLPDLFIEADISTNDGVQKVIEGVLARLGAWTYRQGNVGGSSRAQRRRLALSDADWRKK